MNTFRRNNISGAKMTPQKVISLRHLYAEGKTQRELCSIFGLSIAQVGRIVRGESWRQFEQPAHQDEIAQSLARLAEAPPVPITQPSAPSAPLAEVDAVDQFLERRRASQEAQDEQRTEDRPESGEISESNQGDEGAERTREE
jgi:transcriptional regulator with XRE-family HTH domain